MRENLPRRRVLLVEYEPKFLKEARRILEQGGFLVTAAETGHAALNVIEHEPLQAVITEVSLPDHKGIDILMAVRATYPETPVIMITAKENLAEARDAVREGAFNYVEKSLAVDDLLM